MICSGFVNKHFGWDIINYVESKQLIIFFKIVLRIFFITENQ